MQIIKFPICKQLTWTYTFVLNCLGRERWLVHVGKCKRLPARRPWSARSSATPSQGEFPQRWWWRFGPFSCHLRCNRSFPCHVLGLHATNWEIGQPGFLLCEGTYVSAFIHLSSFRRGSCSLLIRSCCSCWWKLPGKALIRFLLS